MTEGLPGVVLFALVFLALFFVGGFLGAIFLPVPGGVGFWAGGLTLGAFGTGAGTLVISKRF